MVRAAMAELEFECLRAACQPEQLVAQTNPEDRLLAQQAANGGNRVLQRLRIAGAVREENSIGLMFEDIFRSRGAGQNRDAATQIEQVPRNVPLHAEVERNHVVAGARSWRLGAEGRQLFSL